MPYVANTDTDRREMLSTIGVATVDELWRRAGIHQSQPRLNIPEGKSEYEVVRYLSELAAKNADDLICFLGIGYYDHFIPATVAEITRRNEFYTAYTPYQPEASQGTLQAVFEYQSAICRLTNMDVSNASLYDGGTALFEAMMMGVRIARRRKAILAGTVSPIYKEMIRCYSRNLDVELVLSAAPETDTATDIQQLLDLVDSDTACVIVQYPNVFGSIDDWSELVRIVHERGAIAVCAAYPTALSLLKTPGEFGFDIVAGEGQCLGIDLAFGGPYLGFIATRSQYVRKLPGRIAGQTLDKDGKTGYVLTLQTREQHIRREGATSNICTNEGLCALAAVTYLSTIGKEGFIRLGELCMAKAQYARSQLLAVRGVEEVPQSAFFNEFVVRLPMDAGDFVARMIDKGFAPGFPLGRYFPQRKNDLLVAVTEKRTREDIRSLAVAAEAVLC